MTNVELLVENVKRSKADIDEAYNKGYSDGKAEGGENPIHYAKTLANVFNGVTFPEGTEIELFVGKNHDLTIKNFSTAFTASKGAKRIKIECKPQTTAINVDRMFSLTGNDTCLETIDFSNLQAPLTNLDQFCAWRTELKEILGELDVSECTTFNNAFLVCRKLETIRFKPNTIKASISFSFSPDLTLETIDSIVNGYADMTGQTAPVLTFHADVKARVVADDEKEDTDPTKRFWLRTLTSKNVTLA